ncbi:MAG: hypothetical protein ACLSGS_00010 [Adlercreutzia sp.]
MLSGSLAAQTSSALAASSRLAELDFLSSVPEAVMTRRGRRGVVERLGEEVIVDEHPLAGMAAVVDRELAEGDVGDGDVERVVGQRRRLVALAGRPCRGARAALSGRTPGRAPPW